MEDGLSTSLVAVVKARCEGRTEIGQTALEKAAGDRGRW